MYASQTRTNTKYTDFLRSYYPDPSKNVNVTESQTFSNNFVLNTTHNNNLSSLSLNNNSHNNIAASANATSTGHSTSIHDNIYPDNNTTTPNNNASSTAEIKNIIPNEIGLENYSSVVSQQDQDNNGLQNEQEHNSEQTTKFADLFSVNESHALRLKLLKDTSDIHGGIIKVFSDSDLVRLHHKIQESFNNFTNPSLDESQDHNPKNSSNSAKSKRSHSLGGEDSSGSIHPVIPLISSHTIKTGDAELLNVKVDVERSSEAEAENNVTDELEDERQKLRDARIRTGTGTAIGELEYGLHRLQQETLKILSGKRHEDNGISADHEQGPPFLNHVSYQEILKAEHIALRRELLNNIREISRATFFEDLYTGKTTRTTAEDRTRNHDDPDDDAEIQQKRHNSHRQVDSGHHSYPHPDNLDAIEVESALNDFNLRSSANRTADPADRIDEWIRNSQEHLNNLPSPLGHTADQLNRIKAKSKTSDSDKNFPAAQTQSPSLHASLFHDSIWHENEDLTLNHFGIDDNDHHENEIRTIVATAENDSAANSTSHLHLVPTVDKDLLEHSGKSNRSLSQRLLLQKSIIEGQAGAGSDKKKPFIIHNNIVINNFEPEAGDNDNKVNKVHAPHRSSLQNLHQQTQHNSSGSGSGSREVVTQTQTEIFKSKTHTSSKSVDYINFEENEHGHDDDGIRYDMNRLELEGPSHRNVHELPKNSIKTGANNIAKNNKGADEFGSADDEDGPEILSEIDNNNSSQVNPFQNSRISKSTASASSPYSYNHYYDHDHDDDDNPFGSFRHHHRRRYLTASSDDNNYDYNNIIAKSNNNRVPPALLPVIPQPANERFPARIYEPRYKFDKLKFQRESKLTSTLLPSLASAVQLTIDSSMGSPLAFTDSCNIFNFNNFNLNNMKNNDNAHILNLQTNDITNDEMNTFNIKSTNNNNSYSNTTTTTKANHNHFSKFFKNPRINPKDNNNSSSEHPDHNHVRIIQAELLQLEQHPSLPNYIKNPKKGTRVPGVIRRHNMDQWVAKKVWFYVNGDEHIPKFEYRFRPKRDVKNLDGLCDILSNRLKLVNGVRYIFTIDGELVNRLEDLRHENYYVASSTKKFKVIDRMNFESILKPDFQKSFKTKTLTSFPTAFQNH